MLSRVPRAADLPVRIGLYPSGPTGSVLDVPGVGVGHATVWRDEPPPPHGRGVARTGVTVLDPGGNLFRNPVPAGGAVLNGAGECTGFLSMQEWGLAETPVFLTSTMQVGRVLDAACELLSAEDPTIGVEDVVHPAGGRVRRLASCPTRAGCRSTPATSARRCRRPAPRWARPSRPTRARSAPAPA